MGKKQTVQEKEKRQWGKSLTAPRATWAKLILMGVNKNMDMGGSGVIVRKSMKAFVAARKVSYGIRDPFILEAIAAREGLLFVKELGLQKVILEGDAKLLVDMFNRKIKTQTMITVILEDMRLFFSSFEEVLMQFVKCTANGAVDCVARHAFGGNGVCTWEFTLPNWLLSFPRREGCPL